MSSYMQKVGLEILSTHVHVLPAIYMLFVQLGRVSSSAQSRGVEAKFQGFTRTSPVSNNVQQTDVAFGAGALGSDLKACVILWHGCGSHRCFSREPSLIVLISAPHFRKKTSPRSLSLFSFCWVFGCFLATPRPFHKLQEVYCVSTARPVRLHNQR